MTQVFSAGSNHRSPILSAGLSDCTARLWIDISCQFIKCLSHLSHRHSRLREISSYRWRSCVPFYLACVSQFLPDPARPEVPPCWISRCTGSSSLATAVTESQSGARPSCRWRWGVLRGAAQLSGPPAPAEKLSGWLTVTSLHPEEQIMIWNDPQITRGKMCLLYNLWIEGMKRVRQNSRTYGSHCHDLRAILR